jgi:hypothetical protein
MIVCRQKGIGLPVLAHDPPGQGLVEEFADGLDAFLPGHLCHIGRRLDPQVADLPSSKVLKH